MNTNGIEEVKDFNRLIQYSRIGERKFILKIQMRNFKLNKAYNQKLHVNNFRNYMYSNVRNSECTECTEQPSDRHPG